METHPTVSTAARATYDLHAPDSLTIRYGGDIRSWLVAGRTFLMQVAHPAVGAGVWEHSNFRNDPWSRLREIDRSGIQFAFSGRQASLEEGKRLRYLHRNIQGVDTRGRAYHALDPEVYGWVNMVFLDSTITMNAQYGTALTRAQQEQLFAEWHQGGRHFGLKERELPATLDAYWRDYNHMIEHELEYTPVVDYLLKGGAPPRPDLLHHLPKTVWKQAWKPLGAASRALILGSLPPAYRHKIAAHHPWTDEDERRLDRFRRLVRATVPRLPERIRISAPARRAMCPMP